MACDATIEGSWNTAGNNTAHTGYVAGSIGSKFSGEIAWVLENDSGAKVIRDGLLYSLGAKGLQAIDLETGADIWVREFGLSHINGSLTFDNGNLYFVSQRDHSSALYSVDAGTGETNWIEPVYFDAPKYPPTVANGMIYVVEEGVLFAFDQATGGTVFQASTYSFRNDTFPTFDEGRLFTWYTGVFSERVPNTGTPLWSVELERIPFTSTGSVGGLVGPVVANGIAYVYGSKYDFVNYGLKAIDLKTRNILWSLNDWQLTDPPAVAHGSLYVTTSADVAEYDAKTGRILPGYHADAPFENRSGSQPIVTDDAVIVSTNQKTYIYDRLSRKLTKTLPVGGNLSLGENTLVVASRDVGGDAFVFSLCNSKPVTLNAPHQVKETDVSAMATVSIGEKLNSDIKVSLHSSHPQLLALPPTIDIPAGRISVAFPVSILNNASLNPVLTIQIKASAPGYLNSSVSITLLDDELAIPSRITGDWQGLNAGLNRSGYVSGQFGTFLTTEPLWYVSLSNSSDYSLAVGENVLFDSTSRRSLNASSGQQLWENDFIAKKFVYADGNFYSVPTGGSNFVHMYSVDAVTGALNWVSEALEALEAMDSPVEVTVTDSWVLILTGSHLYRLDRSSGKVASEIRFQGTRSTVYGATLIVAGNDGIAAIDINDDSILWQHSLPLQTTFTRKVESIAAANGRAVIVGPTEIRVYDVASGAELWKQTGIFSGTPAITDEFVFATISGLVQQFSAATGRMERTISTGHLLTENQPIVTDDAIIVSSRLRTFVIDRASGELRQTYPYGGKAHLTNDTLFIQSLEGPRYVVAFPLFEKSELDMSFPTIFENQMPATIEGTVNIPEARGSDIVVSLTSNLHPRLEMPYTLVIPAGQTSATIAVKVLDNDFHNENSTGYILASAVGFHSSSFELTIIDNDPQVVGHVPGDWSVAGNGPARTSYVPGLLGDALQEQIRWQQELVGSRVVTNDGTGYVVTWPRTTAGGYFPPELVAFNSKSGQALFSRVTGGLISSSPTVADGYVYVATSNKNYLKVTAINAITGEVKWTYEDELVHQMHTFVDLVVGDGVILVPLDTSGLLALSQETGERLFFSSLNYGKSSPAVVDGRVFTWENRVFRELDLLSGTQRWMHEFPGSKQQAPYSVPALSEDIAVVISEAYSLDQALIAFDINARTIRWSARGNFIGNAAIADSKVFAVESNLVRTFDLKTGVPQEIYYVQAPYLKRELIVTDDAVIVVGTHYTYVWSRRTQEIVGQYRATGLLTLADDTLFVAGGHSLTAVAIIELSKCKLDVNGDAMVTPLDALTIINYLNIPNRKTETRLDVNSDDAVTPLDALLVINWLNRNSTGEGEKASSNEVFPVSLAPNDVDFLLAYFSVDDEKLVVDQLAVSWIEERSCPAFS